MAKMPTPKEIGAVAKTPAKTFSKIGAAPTVKTPATAVTPKAAEVKPSYNRLANLGTFAHSAKGKKKG
jgi:hypothetical protein